MLQYILSFFKQQNSENEQSDVLKKLKQKRTIYRFLASFLFLMVLITIGLSYSMHKLIALAVLSIVNFLMVLLKMIETNRKYIKEKLNSEWGSREHNIDEHQKKFIDRYFRFNTKKSNDTRVIDDHTWNDLDMDQIYEKLDNTFTAPGKAILYNNLRTPLSSKEKLNERNELIIQLGVDESLRDKTLLALHKYGNDKYGSLENYIFQDKIEGKTRFKYLYEILGYSGLLSFLTIIPWGEGALLLIIPIFLINLVTTYLLKSRFEQGIHSIIELRKLITTAIKLSKIEDNKLELITSKLKIHTKELKIILTKTHKLVPQIKSMVDAIYDYFKIMFLLEVRAYYSTVDHIRTHVEDIREIYALVGEIDSLQSIAGYLVNSKDTIGKPSFIEDGNDLKFYDIYNPLVNDSVKNNIIIKPSISESNYDGVVITGTNMSGKTTFLKAMGVNLIVSQSYNFCYGLSYETPFMIPISAIDNQDNISDGKSYYYSEADRILQIIRKVESDNGFKYFCMFDEILKGTNSLERVSGSFGIIDHLNKQNCITIVITHDIDLAKKLSHFDSYHFVDSVDQNGLYFDYKLKSGISETSNAIKLLEQMGYPESVITRANEDLRRKALSNNDP